MNIKLTMTSNAFLLPSVDGVSSLKLVSLFQHFIFNNFEREFEILLT